MLNREEKIESIRLLTNLNLPLVRIRVEKVSPNNPGAVGAKWRRVPQEKWKDVEHYDRLAESFHDCNIAVKTGHMLSNGKYLCILDVDLKKQEGRDWWSRICDRYGDAEFWAGPISRTESGGLHLWFLSEKQYHTAAPLLPGVDFLALGGISFEPPSQFVEGDLVRNAYEWVTAPTVIDAIPDIPGWLRAEVEIRELKQATIRERIDAAEDQYGASAHLPFLEQILSRHTPEGGLEYAAWLRLGMALHDATGGSEDAFEVFDAWGSRVATEKGGDYDPKKTRVSWVSFGNKDNKVRYGTLVRTLSSDKNVQEYLGCLTAECESLFSSMRPAEEQKSHTVDPEVQKETESKEVAEQPEKKAKKKKVKEDGEVQHKERGQTVEHLEMDKLLLAVQSALSQPLIRTNETNGAIEVTMDGEAKKLDQATEDIIILRCLDIGRKLGVKPLMKEKMVRRAINIIADQNKYNPIREYLEGCLATYRKQKIIDDVTQPEVDPMRYRKHLVAGIGLRPGQDAEWFQTAFFFWLRGAICKAFFGFQNPMLCLQGDQGSGKSTLAKALVKKIGTQFYYAGAIDPSDKDHKIKLAQLFLWEPDELGGTTRHADINRLKSLLTLNRVNERPPYGRHVIDMPVVCSFLGTVNDSSFLQDDTGNRRFLVARYYPIDWQATINWLRGVEFDPDLVWGEVYEEILQTRNFAPLMDKAQTMEAVSRAEEVRQRTDLEYVVEELVEFQSPYEEIEEWKLYKKDLRLALEDAGIKIGKFVLQRAIEIIASSQGFRHNAKDCMSMDSMGNRYIRRARLKQTITTAPSMPKK